MIRTLSVKLDSDNFFDSHKSFVICACGTGMTRDLFVDESKSHCGVIDRG